MSVLAPQNDGQLILQLHQRIQSLENSPTTRIGDWVLSDKGGALTAVSSESRTVLSETPDFSKLINTAVSGAITKGGYVSAKDLANALGVLGQGGGDPAAILAEIENWATHIPLGSLAGFFAAFGTSFPKFGLSTVIADLTPLSHFKKLLDGLANNGLTGNSVQTVIAAVRQTEHTIQSRISQNVLDGLAGVEGDGAAVVKSLQTIPGPNVTGIGNGIAGITTTIVDDVHGIIDAHLGALSPSLSGLIGGTVRDLESAWSSFFTRSTNNWTGNSQTIAGAADFSAAALSAAEQAASLSKQAAAIVAQLPQFYGGSGAAGIGIEVEFVGGVPQGTGNSFAAISSTQNQYNGTNGYGATAAAQTDSETVSGIWSTIIPPDTWRGVYLRANVTGTTRVQGQWKVNGDPSAAAYGSYYIPVDPAATFELQIVCYVAGTPTILHTFGPFPLWVSAGNVIVYSRTPILVGFWWGKELRYIDNFGPGWSAQPGYGMYLNSGNNAISLEAVVDTFALNYPGAGQLSVIDTLPISLMGDLYRYGGYLDDGGVPGSEVSWAYWDSGPTAGPQREPLATTESTGSGSLTDLGTVGPEVTVNIGKSGRVEVRVSCIAVNDTAACTANMGWAASGANTIAAGGGDQNLFVAGHDGGGGTATTLLTDQTPGPTTFTSKYSAGGGGTASFSKRDIMAIPL